MTVGMRGFTNAGDFLTHPSNLRRILWIAVLFPLFFIPLAPSGADPYPPAWDITKTTAQNCGAPGQACHFPPVAWPSEPANPQQCYIGDPTNVKLLGHNPTGFASGSKLVNFHNLLSTDTTWPALIPVYQMS